MPTVVCDRHKLRFDPEQQAGCVVCRREAATAAPGTGPGTGPAASDLGAPIAVATAIWLVSALVLFVTHRELAAAYVLEREEPQLEVEFDPDRQPSVGPQTDVALQELEALHREREERTGATGAPLGLPTPEELGQDADRLGEIEAVDSSPVEVEDESADRGEPEGGGR